MDSFDATPGMDARGFVRRECPACHRQFKTGPRQGDGAAQLSRLAGVLPHENASEIDAGSRRLFCFYCGKRAELREWLTAAQRDHLERLGGALAQHLRFEQLAHVSRTLSLNPHPTFIPVRPPPFPAPPGELDIDGMRPFEVPCCGEPLRAASGWAGPFFCPSCGARHSRGPERAVFSLAFVPE